MPVDVKKIICSSYNLFRASRFLFTRLTRHWHLALTNKIVIKREKHASFQELVTGERPKKPTSIANYSYNFSLGFV